MPSGACVIRREGIKGAVWYAKVRDADGRQVKRRLGREEDGWNRQRAERELGKLLDKIEREQWRKPTSITFALFAEEFLAVYPTTKGLKRSTLIDYTNTIRRHLVPEFGDTSLATIAARPELLDRYIAGKLATYAPKTVWNQVATLAVMFKVAKRWRYVQANPVDEIDRPTVPQPETGILSDAEIVALVKAYRTCEAASEPLEREWWAQARRMTLAVLGTALRRGELLALRWQDVESPVARSAGVRPRRIRDAEIEEVPAHRHIRAEDRRRARGAVANVALPLVGEPRLLPPGARNAA
jgi:integrase